VTVVDNPVLENDQDNGFAGPIARVTGEAVVVDGIVAPGNLVHRLDIGRRPSGRLWAQHPAFHHWKTRLVLGCDDLRE
jgi:hypothetical protein